jgi:hypothetical protein
MEDVLDLYQQPYDPRRPVVCMDETSKQLVAEMRKPLAVKAGRPRRVDYEYERRGTADVFVFTEPLRNWRSISVTERRTRLDWAHKVKEIVDERYPDADVVRLVMDNLNTHSPGSLYEAFPAAEARRLTKKLEIHFTPKHGSWLNIAEIELRALTVQCLDRRIPDIKTLAREVAAWERARNRSKARVDWQFATDDARIKLKHLYPRLQS